MANGVLVEAYRQAWTNYRHYSNLRFAAIAGFFTLNGALIFTALQVKLKLPAGLCVSGGLILFVLFALTEWRISELMEFYRNQLTKLEDRLGLPAFSLPPKARYWRWLVTGGVVLLYAFGFAFSFLLLSPGAVLAGDAPPAAFPSQGISFWTIVQKLIPIATEIAPIVTALATLFLACGVGVAIRQYRHNVRTQRGSFLAELHRRAFGEDPDLLSALYHIDYYHCGYPVLRFHPPGTPAGDQFRLEDFPDLKVARGGSGGGKGRSKRKELDLLRPQEGRPLEWHLDKLLAFFQLLGALSRLGLLDRDHVKAVFGYHLANALLHPAVYTYLEFLTSYPKVASEIPLEFRDFRQLAKEIIRERRRETSQLLRRPVMLLSTEPLREELLFCVPVDPQMVQVVQWLVEISSNGKEEKVSEELRELFKKYGYPLSEGASVKPEKGMHGEWRVCDREADRPVKREFTVRLIRSAEREGGVGRKLAVYEKESSALLRIAYEAMKEVLDKDDCWELFPEDFSAHLKGKRILIARTPDEKEELIGYILFFEKKEVWERVLYISQLIIAKEFRRRGYGSALVEMAENFARARGLSAVRATVQPSNKPSRRFFKARGYKKIGEKKIDGKSCGDVLAKNLG